MATATRMNARDSESLNFELNHVKVSLAIKAKVIMIMACSCDVWGNENQSDESGIMGISNYQ
jgi:hypothetical protein